MENRTALITGGAQGIGSAIGDALQNRGARLVVIDLDEDALNSAMNAGRIEAFRLADASDASALTAAVAELKEETGGIDILVNNVGVLRDGLVGDISVEDWDLVLDTNLRAAFVCCQVLAPLMRQRGYGRIVNISSRAWLGNPGQANYSASKGGLVSLTRTLALELAKDGVTVNCVAPGLIDTPLIRSLREEVQERLLRAQPSGAAGSPKDVGDAVAFFASESSSFITGQVLHVCGGKSVKSDW